MSYLICPSCNYYNSPDVYGECLMCRECGLVTDDWLTLDQILSNQESESESESESDSDSDSEFNR